MTDTATAHAAAASRHADLAAKARDANAAVRGALDARHAALERAGRGEAVDAAELRALGDRVRDAETDAELAEAVERSGKLALDRAAVALWADQAAALDNDKGRAIDAQIDAARALDAAMAAARDAAEALSLAGQTVAALDDRAWQHNEQLSYAEKSGNAELAARRASGDWPAAATLHPTAKPGALHGLRVLLVRPDPYVPNGAPIESAEAVVRGVVRRPLALAAE